MKMTLLRKFFDKVHTHTQTVISMINRPDNPASREIEEKLCRNVLKKCLCRKGILSKRYVYKKKYCSMKENIY